MSGKMMRDLSDAVDELAAWADKDRGKAFVLRAADNNADPAKVTLKLIFRQMNVQYASVTLCTGWPPWPICFGKEIC